MAIFAQTARVLISEHKNKPITGTVLLIGRQSVFLTPEGALELLHEEGVAPRQGYFVELDTSTVASAEQGCITDRSFLSMLTDAKVTSLDVSPYEGADVVHDLNEPLPQQLYHIADFILNGSCLDNLFDPATAMKSLSKMLRPSGRMFSFEMGTQSHGAFVMYSPEWFFGFYAANNYDGCRIYIAHFDEDLHDDYDTYLWHPFVQQQGEMQPSANRVEDGDYMIYALGIKGQNSTDDKTPIQGFYRMMQSKEANAHYAERAQHFDTSYPAITIIERPGLPIKPDRRGFAERLYMRLIGVPVHKWMGVTGRPQLRIGDRRTEGANFRYLGKLRNRPPGAFGR
jgi:hypothetical protein